MLYKVEVGEEDDKEGAVEERVDLVGERLDGGVLANPGR